jgi:hypothetical protein
MSSPEPYIPQALAACPLHHTGYMLTDDERFVWDYLDAYCPHEYESEFSRTIRCIKAVRERAQRLHPEAPIPGLRETKDFVTAVISAYETEKGKRS